VERFDAAWRRGEPFPLEDLLHDAAGLERLELLRHALVVELNYRRERGESPTLGEYASRFPEHEAMLRRAFAESGTVAPTPGSAVALFSSNGFILSPPSPLPDTIGKYVVVKELGKGGQGSTYLVRDPDLGNLVVLKRYHGSASVDEAIREGKALIQVRSLHTAQCLGLERDGDAVFLVMEYIPGRCLADILKEGLLAPAAAARLVEQVAEGLEAVHASSMVHRDLKPANIILGDDGAPRLVDFGLAAHLGSASLRVLAGTPSYMAPEQARGQWERIDTRTDLYGLGAVLYRLLTGQAPHPGETQAEALGHACEGVVTSPRVLKKSIPRPLERIILRALAADPARRYASAAEFRQALRRYRLRHRHRAAAGLAVVLVLVGLATVRVVDGRNQVPVPAPVPLSGELTVRVWTPGEGGKRGLKVVDPGALPVEPGELVHLEARLNQPAYAYLLWLDGQGQVVSLYPWGDRKFGDLPAAFSAQAVVHSPPKLDKGWPMDGTAGLETALLLVRRTPLPRDADLAGLIGHLAPSPLREPQEVAELVFDVGQPAVKVNRSLHRSLGPEPEPIDDPLLQLMERLRPHFEAIRAVRFAYRGE
jgi:hypothetical protein